MVDFNGYKDLQEHFANSQAITDQTEIYDRKNHHLQLAVDKLTQRLSISNESEQKLVQQLQTFSKESEDGLSVLYIKLKEQYAQLQQNYSQLEQTTFDLQEKFALAKNEIIEDYDKQIQVFERKINEQNVKLRQAENIHCNELETQQASADLRFDDMQSLLQFQLNDATSRLREANQSCNILREELLIFKSRSNTSMDAANKRIEELERDLRLNQQQLSITQEKLYSVTRNKNLENYSNAESLCDRNVSYNQRNVVPDSSIMHHNKPSTNIINNKIVMYNNEPPRSPVKQNCSSYNSNKYNPLNQEISASKDLSERFVEDTSVQEDLQNHRYQGSILKRNEYRINKFVLPPLRPVSNAKSNYKGSLKKRKLYNPDNLDYFDNFEEKE